jgi:hypothetical protein
MFPSRFLCLGIGLFVCCQSAGAQAVVNSTFLNNSPASKYSDAKNWAPPEVPNNTSAKNYNVNIGVAYAVEVDTNATISNLTLSTSSAGLQIREKTLAVTGTTTDQLAGGTHIDIQSSKIAEAKFNAGTLSRFSNNTLSGNYLIFSQGLPATLQFNGAAVSTLSNAYLGLNGPLARVIDESGNDALINLARVDGGATLSIFDHNVVTNAPFSNEGSLSVSQGPSGTTFTAAVGLTNFDLATHTLTGGNFAIGGFDSTVSPAELRFNGADVVNNGSVIQLIGPAARIADLAGADGLRNLARTLLNGVLLLSQHDLTIPGQFQNDGSLSLTGKSIFTVAGALTNFDPATLTLTGGFFDLTLNSQLRFAGADIAHNSARLSVAEGAMVTDLGGSDALRNFSDNLSSGDFTVGAAVQFTAPGDFKNAGKLTTAPISSRTSVTGKFSVPPGFRFTQTGGATVNEGILIAEQIEILSGTVEGRGTYIGNLTLTNATFTPFPSTVIQGNFTLSAGAHFHFQLYAEPQYEISGKVTLAGTLEVDVPSDGFVSSSSVLTVLKSAQPLSGVFSNASNGARIPTTDGKGSVVVTYGPKAVFVSQYQAEPPPAQLLNISGRAFLSRSDDDPFSDRAVLIGGFIIAPGTAEPKEVVLRGLGPSLTKFGLSPVVADPVLELHAGNGALVATNDNWNEPPAADIAASGLAPTDPREAAIRTTLQPGAYTVVLKEKNGLGGNGVVEIYDLSQDTNSKLANISSRGFTDSSNVLIGGIIPGNGQMNADIVVRAIGPQLRKNGILNALDDPTLEVRDTNGNIVGFNDDWITNSTQISSTGLAPFNNSESAVLLSLPRGSYTAIVRAKGNSGGVALVEFYDLRR